MPTTRPRHVVTETDAISAALDRAADRWPEDRNSRKRLLLRLIAEGDRTLGDADARRARLERRRRTVAETSGRYTGMYGPSYLESLRREWPG